MSLVAGFVCFFVVEVYCVALLGVGVVDLDAIDGFGLLGVGVFGLGLWFVDDGVISVVASPPSPPFSTGCFSSIPPLSASSTIHPTPERERAED